jgi:hypothetical protein
MAAVCGFHLGDESSRSGSSGASSFVSGMGAAFYAGGLRLG